MKENSSPSKHRINRLGIALVCLCVLVAALALPTASRASSRRQSDDQRGGVLQRRLPAGNGALEFGAGAVEPRELVALLRLVEEGVDQRVAGDRLQRPILEAVVARRAQVFVAEVDAGSG